MASETRCGENLWHRRPDAVKTYGIGNEKEKLLTISLYNVILLICKAHGKGGNRVEKNVSAQEAPAPEGARLHEKNVHQKRTQGSRRQKSERKKAAELLTTAAVWPFFYGRRSSAAAAFFGSFFRSLRSSAAIHRGARSAFEMD
jgi:hypothetical protein